MTAKDRDKLDDVSEKAQTVIWILAEAMEKALRAVFDKRLCIKR
jgi:hypothetical protein